MEPVNRPPLPPFTAETAARKARMAEDAWNTRAGLVFVDFERGDLLQLTGATALVLAGDELASAGAERLWRLRVQQVVRRRGALAWRWSAPTG